MRLKSSTEHASTQEEAIFHRDEMESHDEEVSRRAGRKHAAVWLRLLWTQRSFLFRAAIYGLVVSTLVAFLIPRRYSSTARLMPPDNQGGSGIAMMAATLLGSGGSGSSSSSGGTMGTMTDLLGLKSTSDVFVGILSSRTAEDAVIRKFDLKKVYGNRQIEDARENLAHHTNVEVDRKTQIITITVTDRKPERAAGMVQTYIEQLNYLVTQLSTSSARRERIFLEGRLQGVKQDLEASEKDFSRFASQNTAINVPEQGKAMVDAAATLQGELIAAESELEGLKQAYTDNNVRVRSITARIDELRRQLDKLAGKGEGTSNTPPQNGESYPSLRKLPLLGVTYADLYRETKVQEAVYESLTQEYELAKVQEAKEIPTVKVLDPPDVPGVKSFPPRMLIMILGTALAYSLGVMLVFARAVWEDTDPGDPGKVLAQEVAGTVRAHLPWVSSNGSDMGALKEKDAEARKK